MRRVAAWIWGTRKQGCECPALTFGGVEAIPNGVCRMGECGMESVVKSFGDMHFETVNLGDQRRNRRLPLLVDALVQHPGGTLPEKLPRPADLEAFYRLCAADEVTHEAVLASHRQLVLQKLQDTRKYLLVVQDATELDYSSHHSLSRVGQIGNGRGHGYVVQNALAIDPQQGVVLGLANQILHVRVNVPQNEKVAAKRKRKSRESRLWIRGTQELPSKPQVVDVCDRAADGFEFLEHEVRSNRTFVVRAHHDRNILIGHDVQTSQAASLISYARSLPAVGADETIVRIASPSGKKRRVAKNIAPKDSNSPGTYRTARLSICAAAVRLRSPHVRRGEHGRDPLSVWIVRIWESDPPAGFKPLEWFLLTNHPADDATAAKRVKNWYEWRWVIEEYHKGLKTGCAIEKLQMRDEARLDPAIGVLSIVALSLLQLRDAARRPDAKSRRAEEMVDPEAIQVLSAWLHQELREDWTVHEYYIALARLGGYRPRKNCPPGWQVLWRGQTKLNLMLQGARTLQLLKHKPKNQAEKCAKS